MPDRGLEIAADAGDVRGRPDRDRFRLWMSPRLTTVPSIAMRLQRRAAAAVLARLGLWYLPRVLLERLGQYDAQYALADYFTLCGVDYDVLVTPSHVEHAAQRAKLERLHELFLSAERSIQGVGFLHLGPLMQAIKVSDDEAERLVAVMERIAAVWRALHASTVRWPGYKGFVAAADGRLMNWQTISDQELVEIFSAWHAWESLRQRIYAVFTGIDHLRERAERQDALAEILLILNAATEKCRTVAAELDGGLAAPDEALADLEDLFDRIEVLMEEAPTAASNTDVLKLEWSCKILGVPTNADQTAVEKAFRRLAKLYHPDLNQDDPLAGQRMSELNDAHDIMMLHFMNSQAQA